MLLEIDMIFDGNMDFMLMKIVEKLNVTIVQRLWVEGYLDSNIILLELGRILNLVHFFRKKLKIWW